MADKKIICTVVRMADGSKVECKVLEQAYNPYQLFPSLLVELFDVPYGGSKKIVIDQSQLEYSSKGEMA